MPQGCKAQAPQSWPHKGPCWWLNTACEPCGVGTWITIRSSASGPVAVADCCSSQALSALQEFHDRPGAAWTWQAVHWTTMLAPLHAGLGILEAECLAAC
jgi:hypothetical protein